VTPGDDLLLLLARGTFTADVGRHARALAAGASWPRLLALADAHGVSPLVARNLESLGWPCVPPSAREALEARRRINAARALRLGRALARALDELGAAAVPVIPLKGPALAEALFGDAALREFSDVDILVPRASVARACAALAAAGYARDAREEPVAPGEVDWLLEGNIEYGFISPDPPGCLVELHWDIAWRWCPGPDALADLWADARPRAFRGREAQAVGPEWDLLYLAVHAARHRWGRLKWLVDVHELCARREIDGAAVGDKARRFGLGAVVAITLGACRALLGTPVPPGAPAVAPPPWLDLFPATPGALGVWRGVLYPARLLEGPSAGLRYLARVLLRPTLAERRLVRLPATLRPLYSPLRVLRLGLRGGRDALRLCARNAPRAGAGRQREGLGAP